MVAHDTALVAVDFGEPEGRLWQFVRARFGSVELVAASDPLGAISAMQAYLAGDLEALDRLPVDGGGTLFQRDVWAALREIPAGTTWSYKKLAEHVGRPAAVRAVGLANGANPLAIVVPCHRGHRLRRLAHRLWRRPAAQALAARA